MILHIWINLPQIFNSLVLLGTNYTGETRGIGIYVRSCTCDCYGPYGIDIHIDGVNSVTFL